MTLKTESAKQIAVRLLALCEAVGATGLRFVDAGPDYWVPSIVLDVGGGREDVFAKFEHTIGRNGWRIAVQGAIDPAKGFASVLRQQHYGTKDDGLAKAAARLKERLDLIRELLAAEVRRNKQREVSQDKVEPIRQLLARPLVGDAHCELRVGEDGTVRVEISLVVESHESFDGLFSLARAVQRPMRGGR